jgi:Ca2+-binding EF-hand superfamily protein
MADKNTLKEMSQDVLVIPFSDELAESLDSFCCKQAESMTMERFGELTISFLNRENDDELEEAFETFCKEEGVDDNLSKNAIMPVLAEHIVLKSVEEAESSEESALYSLMLKNALILAVKGNGFVAYPEAISETFSTYNDFIMDERTFGKEDEENAVTCSLLDSEVESLTVKINEADGEVLKAIAYDAALYRYEQMVAEIKIDSDNLVQSIYEMVGKLVSEAPWKYIDCAPAETIKKILGEVVNIEVKLGDVIDCLSEEKEEDDLMTTSILMRLISGDDSDIELSRDVRFGAAEFAVYLYYEMLAEAISKELEETEE